MTRKIKIKRKTSGTGAPPVLEYGELATDTVGTVYVGNVNGTPTAVGAPSPLQKNYDAGNIIITAGTRPVSITVPDTSNNVGLVVNQNDVTNSPAAISIINTGSNSDIVGGTNWDISKNYGFENYWSVGDPQAYHGLATYGSTETQAKGTIVFGTIPTDGDTVTVDDQIYTFKDAFSAGPTVSNEILIDGTIDGTIGGLLAAIVESPRDNEGIMYSVGTLQPTLAGAQFQVSGELIIVALTGGFAGNAIVFTSSFTAPANTTNGPTLGNTLSGVDGGFSYAGITSESTSTINTAPLYKAYGLGTEKGFVSNRPIDITNDSTSNTTPLYKATGIGTGVEYGFVSNRSIDVTCNWMTTVPGGLNAVKFRAPSSKPNTTALEFVTNGGTKYCVIGTDFKQNGGDNYFISGAGYVDLFADQQSGKISIGDVNVDAGTNQADRAELQIIPDSGIIVNPFNDTTPTRKLQVNGRICGHSCSISSANNLTLTYANLAIVSGNIDIHAITTTGWTAGSEITLIFLSNLTVRQNTAGGANTAPILLEGSVDFPVDANYVLKLIYDGTVWQEVSRKWVGA